MKAPTPEYFGLTALPGVAVMSSTTLPDLACPFCGNPNLAFLAGKIRFSATVGSDSLFDRASLAMVGVICQRSHIFFLRQSDCVLSKAT
jgi:hypothetical protein